LKKNIIISILVFTLFLLILTALNSAEKKLTESEKDFIIEHIGGIWTIEKRVFSNGDAITPPDIRGYLIITKDYWTQIEAQVVEKGGVEPFSGSYFGSTDFHSTRSIEKIYLQVRSSYDDSGNPVLSVSTEESEQKSRLVLEKDGVTQRFDGGGSVTMKNDRFTQERDGLYTTYWLRIKKPAEVF